MALRTLQKEKISKSTFKQRHSEGGAGVHAAPDGTCEGAAN